MFSLYSYHIDGDILSIGVELVFRVPPIGYNRVHILLWPQQEYWDSEEHCFNPQCVSGEVFGIACISSFLDCEDQKFRTQVQVSILNILSLFVVLTQNESLNSEFFNNQLHKHLYKSIKFSTPIFSLSQKIWAKEPMIRKSMVSLICRILSGGRVDEGLA